MSIRPVKIKIVNMDFTIEYVHKGIENGAQKFGWTDLNRQCIYISDDLTLHKEADTLIHEILHALCWIFDLEDEAKVEAYCRRLSSGILAVWRDNLELFDYLHSLIFPSG